MLPHFEFCSRGNRSSGCNRSSSRLGVPINQCRPGFPRFFVESTTMRRTVLDDPRYYLNRHVQWLDFNRRVLEEACEPGNSPLACVKILAITAKKLEEFVEVRGSHFVQRI